MIPTSEREEGHPYTVDIPSRNGDGSYKCLYLPMGRDRDGTERTPTRLTMWQAKAVVNFCEDIREFIKAYDRPHGG